MKKYLEPLAIEIKTLTVCGNLYFLPDNYHVDVENDINVELKNERIHVNTLYYISRFDNIDGVNLQNGFIDIYIFEHKGLSYLIVRYVEDNGIVHNKIIKSKCNSDKVDVSMYLPF